MVIPGSNPCVLFPAPQPRPDMCKGLTHVRLLPKERVRNKLTWERGRPEYSKMGKLFKTRS